jgi:hypothetical protein
MNIDKIIFDFEGRDEACAMFALYAGLRMYKELKQGQEKDGEMSIAGAEAYCLLMDIEEQYPKEFAECKAEFEMIYKS